MLEKIKCIGLLFCIWCNIGLAFCQSINSLDWRHYLWDYLSYRNVFIVPVNLILGPNVLLQYSSSSVKKQIKAKQESTAWLASDTVSKHDSALSLMLIQHAKNSQI